MKKTILLVATIFILNINAQETQKMNIIKTNVTAYVFRNINLTYERSINKWFSINTGFGIMPQGKVPFLNNFLNSQDKEKFKNLEVKSSNFTLEPRFYIGKGYGRGFYFAPYYRYSKVTSNTFDFVYDYQPAAGLTYQVPIKGYGNTDGNSGGLMVGSQFFLTKSQNLVLDLWIAGAHYGVGKGIFDFTTDQTLTPEMQAQLKQQIEDLNIPYIKYTVQTNSHGAHIDVNGPWAGFRSGLSLGFRF
jgi:hypothetical protein